MSQGLKATGFPFCKMKGAVGMDDEEDSTMGMRLIPRNCALKNNEDGKFCLVRNLT